MPRSMVSSSRSPSKLTCMKINMLLKFPQAGFKKEDVADICAKLDALDA